MPENQISLHEIRVYEAVKRGGGWMTAREVAAAADVADRTARLHVAALAALEVFEIAKLFGGYRYRMSSQPGDAGKAYLADLEQAKRVFSA